MAPAGGAPRRPVRVLEQVDAVRSHAELEATQERIGRFQEQVTHLRKMETNSVNYRLSASGFLAEIDRMQLEVREYLSLLPTELAGSKCGCSHRPPLPRSRHC